MGIATIKKTIDDLDQVLLTNRSGSTTTIGNVYRVDPNNNESFIFSNDDRQSQVAVAISEFDNLSQDLMLTGGGIDVMVDDTVSRGDYLYFSSTNGQAKGISGVPKTGNFGWLLEARTGAGLVKAMIRSSAIGSLIASGDTFPTGAFTGEQFRLILANRDVTYEFNGSVWIPQKINDDTMYYVDKTDGTDSAENGFDKDSNAFATIQFMRDQLPGLITGEVIIKINGENYDEDIDIGSKNFTGNFSITINGTWTTLEAVTSATVAKGSGATHGTVTKAGQFTGDSYAGKMAYFVTDDEYRVIVSHTNDVLTLAGLAPSSTTQNVNVLDWETSVNFIAGVNGQKSLIINFIKYTASFSVSKFVEITWNNCWFTTSFSMNKSDIQAVRCYFQEGMNLTNNCTGTISNNFADITSGRFAVVNGSNVFIGQANVIDGNGSGSDAILAFAAGVVGMFTNAGTGFPIVRNWTTGLNTRDGGIIFDTDNNQYSGNTTDENPSGASDPAFID